MPQGRESFCPVCKTINVEGRCPNVHCPNCGFCPKCSSPLNPEGRCTSDTCSTNRPTIVPSMRPHPFIPSRPPSQSYQRLMAIGRPFSGAYERVLSGGSLRRHPDRFDRDFQEEEPPTLRQRPGPAQSGTYARTLSEEAPSQKKKAR